MICARCIALLLGTLLTFSSAQASETLLNHVKLAGQTMSAMYMKSLSEGNEKYQDDLDLYKKQSHAALEQYVSEGGDQAVALLKQWQGFSDELKVVYSKDFGWDIEEWVRTDFRSYLSRVYQLTEQNKASYDTPHSQMMFAEVQLEAMAARFFDIANCYNGTLCLSSKDADSIPPKRISQEFKKSLQTLADNSGHKAIKKRLLSAKYKWEFVEEGVVNYSDQSAFFVVYATKYRIHKVLKKSQALLTSI